MKSGSLLSLLILTLLSCTSIKDANGFLDEKIEPSLLKDDVDDAFTNIKKYHPKLHWYITEENLDYKIDSLKNTINTPLTPSEFFFKIAPVISQIKEGHLRVKFPSKKYTKKQLEQLKLQTPLFGQLSYKIVDDKMFIADVNNKELNAKVGDEVLKIGSHSVKDLVQKYKTITHGDGEVKSFQRHSLNRQFIQIFSLEQGILDRVTLELKEKGKIKQVHLVRKLKSDSVEVKPFVSKVNNRIYDYNKYSQTYNRSMRFLKADSSVAYMKIKKFSQNGSSKFYKYTFDKIKNAKTKYLILDIRDNLGGSLTEINNLYSYIAKEDFTLIKTPEMNFKNAPLHRNYFHGLSTWGQTVASLGYPGFVLNNLMMSKSTENGKFYYKQRASKKTNIKRKAFTGEVFLIVNGSSFSASAIIAAKFKEDKRGLIIGEETGGANDGTVAGFYNTIELKHSKLKIPIGLLLIQPNINFHNKNRGVMPDVDISYDQYKFNEKKDLEIEWILNDIGKKAD